MDIWKKKNHKTKLKLIEIFLKSPKKEKKNNIGIEVILLKKLIYV